MILDINHIDVPYLMLPAVKLIAQITQSVLSLLQQV